MWRSHFVVLGEEPTESSLAKVTDGYQLWRESRTGLFYLTAHSEPLGARPDFAQFLDRSTRRRIDLSLVERFISDTNKPVDLQKHEVSFDLIRQTATLSNQLNMAVLAAEDTDDDYGMAVVVDNDVITYLRFKTMLKDAPEDNGAVEVVYTPQTGFVIDNEFNQDAYGAAQKAIEDVFGEAGLNLYNYSDAKPTREDAKQHATARNLSVQAYLDSYGVFKRLRHAPPQLTLRDRLVIPFRFLFSAILIPFIFVGILIYVMIYEGKAKAVDPNMGVVILIGMAVLALPIWLIIWALRAMLGY